MKSKSVRSPEYVAAAIVAGIKKDKHRVLAGTDSVAIDKIVRLLPAATPDHGAGAEAAARQDPQRLTRAEWAPGLAFVHPLRCSEPMPNPLLHKETPAEDRIAHRLQSELIIWLTTVSPDAAPHSVPVWFHWSDPTITAFSRPRTAKIRDLRRNQAVGLHLDSAQDGADIVLLEGHADLTPPNQISSIVESFERKYRPTLGDQSIAAWHGTFSEPITVVAHKLIAWTRSVGGLDYVSLSADSWT